MFKTNNAKVLEVSSRFYFLCIFFLVPSFFFGGVEFLFCFDWAEGRGYYKLFTFLLDIYGQKEGKKGKKKPSTAAAAA